MHILEEELETRKNHGHLIVCKIYVKNLRTWTKGMKKALRFGIPIIQREPNNHGNDC